MSILPLAILLEVKHFDHDVQTPSGITTRPPTFKQVPVAMDFLSIMGTLSPQMHDRFSSLTSLPFCFAFGCGFVY